jgi:hypothetical protein
VPRTTFYPYRWHSTEHLSLCTHSAWVKPLGSQPLLTLFVALGSGGAGVLTLDLAEGDTVEYRLVTTSPPLGMVAAVALDLQVISLPSAVFEWATVCDPANSPDPRLMSGGTTGYGSVADVYRISLTEVTSAAPLACHLPQQRAALCAR